MLLADTLTPDVRVRMRLNIMFLLAISFIIFLLLGIGVFSSRSWNFAMENAVEHSKAVYLNITNTEAYHKSTSIRDANASSPFHSNSNIKNSKVVGIHASQSLPNNSEKVALTKNDIFIGINLGLGEEENARAVIMTWARDLQPSFGFYSCPNFTDDLKFLEKISDYPCLEYPPISSLEKTLKHMGRQDNVKWFVKCDVDTYVNVPQLLIFLQYLHDKGLNPNDPYYFGSIGHGRQKERHLLGLDNRSFVMGGPCICISSGAMKLLMPIIETCMYAAAVNMHSDTQVARCFVQLKVPAGLPIASEKRLNTLFRQYYSRLTVSSHDGTSIAPFPSSTIPIDFTPSKEQQITIHSIKDIFLMYRVHAQVHYNARPINIAAGRSFLKRMGCSHNPMLVKAVTACKGVHSSPNSSRAHYRSYNVIDRCSVKVPECEARPSKRWDRNLARIDKVFIVCNGQKSCKASSLHTELLSLGFGVEIVRSVKRHQLNVSSPILPLEEIAVRASFRSVFTRIASSPSIKTVMILEEKAVLDRNFTAQLDVVLSSPRCACHLVPGSGCTPGILWLGMTLPSNTLLKEYHDTQPKDKTSCINLLPSAHGALGAVYSADIIPWILFWLDSRDLLPFQYMHTFLSMEGFVMRGLRDPIVTTLPRRSVAISSAATPAAVNVTREAEEESAVTGDEASAVTGHEASAVTGDEASAVTGDEASAMTGDEAIVTP